MQWFNSADLGLTIRVRNSSLELLPLLAEILSENFGTIGVRALPDSAVIAMQPVSLIERIL